jgi:hypothetical protein
MGNLRKPFLVLALLVMLLVVLIESASSFVVGGADASSSLQASAGDLGVDMSGAAGVSQPPGRGISYLALVDVILLYTVLLFTISLVLSKRFQGKVQGVVTLIFSILLILAALVLLIIAFIELMLMITLFLAFPFGTIFYLIVWGFFPVGESAALLSLLMFLKLVFGVLLLLAHQRFLQNKGLVLMVLTSLLCNLILAFLHHFVPVILVSIADDIGAIVFAIVAIIWGIVLLIGSIPSIWKAIRTTAAIANS